MGNRNRFVQVHHIRELTLVILSYYFPLNLFYTITFLTRSRSSSKPWVEKRIAIGVAIREGMSAMRFTLAGRLYVGPAAKRTVFPVRIRAEISSFAFSCCTRVLFLPFSFFSSDRCNKSLG